MESKENVPKLREKKKFDKEDPSTYTPERGGLVTKTLLYSIGF